MLLRTYSCLSCKTKFENDLFAEYCYISYSVPTLQSPTHITLYSGYFINLAKTRRNFSASGGPFIQTHYIIANNCNNIARDKERTAHSDSVVVVGRVPDLFPGGL